MELKPISYQPMIYLRKNKKLHASRNKSLDKSNNPTNLQTERIKAYPS